MCIALLCADLLLFAVVCFVLVCIGLLRIALRSLGSRRSRGSRGDLLCRAALLWIALRRFVLLCVASMWFAMMCDAWLFADITSRYDNRDKLVIC